MLAVECAMLQSHCQTPVIKERGIKIGETQNIKGSCERTQSRLAGLHLAIAGALAVWHNLSAAQTAIRGSHCSR